MRVLPGREPPSRGLPRAPCMPDAPQLPTSMSTQAACTQDAPRLPTSMQPAADSTARPRVVALDSARQAGPSPQAEIPRQSSFRIARRTSRQAGFHSHTWCISSQSSPCKHRRRVPCSRSSTSSYDLIVYLHAATDWHPAHPPGGGGGIEGQFPGLGDQLPAETAMRLGSTARKSRAFVDPPCGEQLTLRPQCDFAIARTPCEAYAFVDQTCAESESTRRWLD